MTCVCVRRLQRNSEAGSTYHHAESDLLAALLLLHRLVQDNVQEDLVRLVKPEILALHHSHRNRGERQ